MVISLLLFSVSCRHEQTAPADFNPEDTIRGRKVVAFYPDSTPGIVHFYKVDEAGNLTPELEREVQYYPNKQKYIDCGYTTVKTDSSILNLKNGPAFAYFDNGQVQVEAFYVEGKQNGDYKLYREDGKKYLEGAYDMGMRTGKWKFYDEKGKLVKEGTYEKDICVGTWTDYGIDGKVRKQVEADEHTIGCGDCPKCRKLSHNK